jgi:hypothetical protein
MKLFRATTHPTTPARIGTPVGSAAMEALIDQPGPVEVKTVGTDWVANLSGLLNRAVASGLRGPRTSPVLIDRCTG